MSFDSSDRESVKLIAFHLPQFHTFPENDEWWGKGFTEWTNTKKAQKLFPMHNQPREPYENNYYDLSRIENMLWQMELAREYGIYGFCYYHYWFHGRLLLHKPLELIRDYKGEKLPYCLCWANEPWTRAWENNTEVLVAQEYGGKASWEKHFEYLLRYFKDPAYIQLDHKPVLVLYRSNNIPDCDEMIAYWDKRCQESGFAGIYLIEEMNSFQDKACCRNSSAVLEFEPLYTMKYARTFPEKLIDKMESLLFCAAVKSKNQIYSYDRLWNRILKRNHNDTKHRLPGAFVDWDNTARKGSRGRIVMGATPLKFQRYLAAQREIGERLGSEFIFLNAWNEWGEGTYLEPDQVNGFQYLEAVKSVFQ